MLRNHPAKSCLFLQFTCHKKIVCNYYLPSVVIEVEVTAVTKIYFLKHRLSASFTYPLLFRNEALLRRSLFIIKAESCAQHMIKGSVQIKIDTLHRLLISWNDLAVLGSSFESKNLVCCTNLHKSGLQK